MMKKLNILVVDDDEANAASLAELFEADDHRVTVAHDGQEAVDAFAAADFDLGFFDVMMPRKNGVESFLEIRLVRPKAQIYFMTGYSDSELLDKAKAGGAMGVFSKPADPALLLDAVERRAA
jgi:CheY-like chemotaxis protein